MSDTKDTLGDRMKEYENKFDFRVARTEWPILARLDGKGFSKFTKGLARPYDTRLSAMMVTVAETLAEETGAVCAYTQSDEITIAWYNEVRGGETWFAGRIQKLASILASKASVYFNKLLPEHLPEKSGEAPVFDCRVFTCITKEETANCFLWRELDATKNAISMAAREYFSHNQLMNKNGKEMVGMMGDRGVNFYNLPVFFRYGTFIQRKVERRQFTIDEIEKLPPLHNARTNPTLEFDRTEYKIRYIEGFKNVRNRVGFILYGEEPIYA